MSTGPLDPFVGRCVDDRYELVARRARGGMATVYEAVDRRLDRRVAVKLMHPHLAESPEFVERFRREARAAARLNHPHVVAVHDQGVWDSMGYLVMEMIDGPDLRRELRRLGSLPLGEALDVVAQVLDALGAAHRAGLVHRDIKPENVLLAPTSHGPTVKVTDFGLARAVSEATAASTGTMLGTVAYLAPEVATQGVADPRADVYATGIMLVELLTGHPPFEGSTPIQVAYRHVQEDVPAPSTTAPWIPAEVDRLVAALTARDPQARPADGAAALELLRDCVAAQPRSVLRRRHPVTPAPAEPPRDGRALPDDGDATREPRSGETAALTGLHTARLDLGAVQDAHPTHALPRMPGHPAAPVPDAPSSGVVAAPPRHRRRLARVLAVLLVLVAAAVLAVAAWFRVGPGATTPLPDVAGLPAQQAVDVLDEQGWVPNVVEEHHDTVEKGTTIGTGPEAGSPLRRGEPVDVLVSLGVLMIEVPDVTGTDVEASREALATAGLVGDVAVTEEHHDSVPQGVVVTQRPAAGETVDHRSGVDLVVSRGPAPVTIPDLTGLSRADAEQRLEDLGLTATVGPRAHHEWVPLDHVAGQTPAGGEQVHRGDGVELVLSDGPETAEVPDVVGLQVEDAVELLEGAGFTVERRDFLGGYFGSVRMQEPTGGTTAPVDTVVRLTVV